MYRNGGISFGRQVEASRRPVGSNLLKSGGTILLLVLSRPPVWPHTR